MTDFAKIDAAKNATVAIGCVVGDARDELARSWSMDGFGIITDPDTVHGSLCEARARLSTAIEILETIDWPAPA
jgi:hypothetical protein